MDDAFEPNDASDADDDAWTPRQGLIRAAVWGLVAAIVLAGLCWPLAAYLPLLVLHMLLRGFLALLVAWILFDVVHRSAGFVGWPCTALVVVLALAVMLSHHVVFAACGVPTRSSGVVSGLVWLAPATLALYNSTTLVGIGFSAALRHFGGADLKSLAELLMQGVPG